MEPDVLAVLGRGQLFAALAAIGFANGISERVALETSQVGWLEAILNTFEISVIVWGALLAVLVLLWRAPPQPVKRADVAVTIIAGAAFVIPIPSLSWVALTGVALHLLRSTRGPAGGAGLILLALTLPMFWAKVVMATFSAIILQVDATLVAWVVGTQRNGNLVPFADGSGSLWIAPGCSSFDNISLALVCSVTLMQVMGRRWSVPSLLWGLGACLAVIAINTIRIALIGIYPQGYELFHGPVGASVAGLATTVAVVGLCHLGATRSAKAPG